MSVDSQWNCLELYCLTFLNNHPLFHQTPGVLSVHHWQHSVMRFLEKYSSNFSQEVQNIVFTFPKFSMGSIKLLVETAFLFCSGSSYWPDSLSFSTILDVHVTLSRVLL